MISFFVKLIEEGKLKIEDVPMLWRNAVSKKLEENAKFRAVIEVKLKEGRFGKLEPVEILEESIEDKSAED